MLWQPAIIPNNRWFSKDYEDPLEKGLATHSSILAWRIPWIEEPGRLQSIGRQELDMKSLVPQLGIKLVLPCSRQPKVLITELPEKSLQNYFLLISTEI